MELKEDSNEKLSWSALEYDFKEHDTDWFWALGIIIVASSGASIIYENYFFGALLIISGVLLGFFANKEPELVNYELNQKGLKIKNRLYRYENIKSFFVTNATPNNPEIKPTLFIRSERIFIPIIAVPIENEMAEDIHMIFLEKNIKEEEMREHASEKIMDFLGF